MGQWGCAKRGSEAPTGEAPDVNERDEGRAEGLESPRCLKVFTGRCVCTAQDVRLSHAGIALKWLNI